MKAFHGKIMKATAGFSQRLRNLRATGGCASVASWSAAVGLASSIRQFSSSSRAMGDAAIGPTMQSKDALRCLKEADAVFFDVDSTVLTGEGIDVLAAHLGVGDAVAALTAGAMRGDADFRDALSARLGIMKPSKDAVDNLVASDPLELTPGMQDLVDLLHARGTHVYFVSGGFEQMIYPVSDGLAIPRERVFANRILFDSDGKYAGFREEAPTSRSGGKARVLSEQRAAHGYRCMVMVGDGATDLEARPPAQCFIGYGGIAVREKVEMHADWFVKDWRGVVDSLRQ